MLAAIVITLVTTAKTIMTTAMILSFLEDKPWTSLPNKKQNVDQYKNRRKKTIHIN